MNDSKCIGEHGGKKKKRYSQGSLHSLNSRLAQEHEKKKIECHERNVTFIARVKIFLMIMLLQVDCRLVDLG